MLVWIAIAILYGIFYAAINGTVAIFLYELFTPECAIWASYLLCARPLSVAALSRHEHQTKEGVSRRRLSETSSGL
ncbi:hypothetical protein BN2476_210062 [Paraburkholderia piptadeniae]|uniref:Uncharacterized protein n=1 Tax=Paraburkholderia piptadeniae TaxID=1701573 RepID=A0A1N7RVL9_9BURK|nr:hypothetical protein BN2476_210062 [Paraburkholderia piptadeniae]